MLGVLAFLLDDIFFQAFACLGGLYRLSEGCLCAIVLQFQGKGIDDFYFGFMLAGKRIDSPLPHQFFALKLLLLDGLDGGLGHNEER